MRDLRGLPARQGGEVRGGVLLRSGSLRLLTDADAAVLVADYGVRTVVDLRSAPELAADGPSALARAGVATTHLPLISGNAGTQPYPAPEIDLRIVYRTMITSAARHLTTAVRTVAWGGPGAVLVHCAAGKDRTGLTVALVLDAVGVEREPIIADYLATGTVVAEVFAALVRSTGDPDLLDRVPLAARAVEPDALRAVLDQLDREYGGAAGWLLAQGMTATELSLLRHRLVLPAGSEARGPADHLSRVSTGST